MEQLPEDIQLDILSYLNRQDLCTLCQVNTRWQELAKSNKLWKEIYLKDFDKAHKVPTRGSWFEQYRHTHNQIVKLIETETSFNVSFIVNLNYMFKDLYRVISNIIKPC